MQKPQVVRPRPVVCVPLAIVRVILALAFLFFGTWSSCNAGYYQVVSGYPQGGTGTGPSHSDGGSGTQPYNGSVERYGGGGGRVLSNPSASANGAITTVFQWVGGSSDPPPRKVLVTQSCSANATGKSFGASASGSGNVNNGLGVSSAVTGVPIIVYNPQTQQNDQIGIDYNTTASSTKAELIAFP